MKVVFMGTPDFAVGTLEKIIEHGHEVVGVVTQPDKPKGRRRELSQPPVKEAALVHGLEVYQPARIKDNDEFYELMTELAPDVMVVVAFGQLLPQRILDIPKYGCINVHASLLPAYRGAAPIQWAVIDGLEETGVTTMLMDAGLDTGDILMQHAVKLDVKETGGSLFDKLQSAGAELLVRTLDAVENGTVTRTKQDDSKSNYAGMLSKELGDIDFTQSAVSIERLIRGLNPWPSAYTSIGGKKLKLWDADVCSSDSDSTFEPGQISGVTKDAFYVQCGDGTLKVNEVQMEGKKRMRCDAFLRGFKLEKGYVLNGK